MVDRDHAVERGCDPGGCSTFTLATGALGGVALDELTDLNPGRREHREHVRVRVVRLLIEELEQPHRPVVDQDGKCTGRTQPDARGGIGPWEVGIPKHVLYPDPPA